MLQCPKCALLYATRATHCVVCQAPFVTKQSATQPVRGIPKTCDLCSALMTHAHPRSRFCSDHCKHKATYLYRKDPETNAHLGPRYTNENLKRLHAAVADAKEKGLITPNTQRAKFEIPQLNNAVDVVWMLIDADTPLIKASESDAELKDLILGSNTEDTPAAYATWRAKQPWAKPTELAERLTALTGTPTAPQSVGVTCVCSLCDRRFTSPFQTDICLNCRD